MIDLHSHILPGIDDGAQTLEDSLAMAKSAVANGISHLLCTPHHNNGVYKNSKQEIIDHVAALQRELDARNIPLTLFEGQEIRITGELLTELAQDQLLCVDLDNRYMLIEFPTQDVPAYTEQLFFDLLSKNITPVIVHPERNSVFIEEPNKLLPFLEMGVLAQLTAPSYVGVFGKKIQKTAFLMLEHNMVQMIASDAHNVLKRDFYMREAYELLAKDFGRKKVALFKQTNRALINGDAVSVSPPTVAKKGLFNNWK